METISITQLKNTMIEEIMQGLSEQLESARTGIEDTLLSGDIQSATEIIHELTSSFEDLIWKSYLNNLFKCKIILVSLRNMGARKALRFVSYQKIQIRSPFFVKAAPKRGRKKRGPQQRGEHLLLSILGFIHKVEPSLAFRAVQLAVVAPSFDIAAQILEQEGVKRV